MKSLRIYTVINCKDCAQFHQTVDDVCTELNISKLLIDVDLEVNLEKNLEEMLKYKVLSIPYTIVCTDGVPGQGAGGILTADQLKTLININVND